MYDNLVETLRFCAKNGECHDCPYEKPCAGMTGDGLYCEAADAIEKLDREYESVSKSLNEAVELVRKLQKPRWIPVTERLPEDGEDVLCWISDNRRSGQGYEMVGCYNSTLKLWDMDADWVSSLDITHWRTLPAPPKEDA